MEDKDIYEYYKNTEEYKKHMELKSKYKKRMAEFHEKLANEDKSEEALYFFTEKGIEVLEKYDDYIKQVKEAILTVIFNETSNKESIEKMYWLVETLHENLHNKGQRRARIRDIVTFNRLCPLEDKKISEDKF